MNYILLFLFTLAGIISLTAAKPGGHDKKCPEYKTICLMQGVPTVQICQRGKYVHMMRCDGKGQTCHDGSGQDNQCGQQFTSPVNAHCRDCEVAIHGCLKDCPYYPVSKSCIKDCKNLIHLQQGCGPHAGCDREFDGFSSAS